MRHTERRVPENSPTSERADAGSPTHLAVPSFRARLALGLWLLASAAWNLADAADTAQLLEISYEGEILARVTSSEPGDELGSQIGTDVAPAGGGCLVGAPGANGSVGRIVVYDVCSLRSSEPVGIVGRELYDVDGGALSGGPTARFGEQIANIGHVFQESAVHWAIGAPGGDEEGTAPALVVLHRGGNTLVERFRIEGPPGSRLGWRATVFHLEPGNSYFSRVAVTAPGLANGSRRSTGAVHAIDSETGELLWTRLGKKKRQFLGYSLAGFPDWDGDGVDDLLVGAPNRPKKKGKGEVWIVSGADGRRLARIRAPKGARWFGFSLAATDVDGDGARDVVVGAPFTDAEAGKAAGSVFVFSGADLSLIERWDGDAEGQWLGVNVASARIDPGGLFALVAGSIHESRKKRRDRRGGIAFYSIDEGRVLFELLGKKADDRLGWRLLRCNPLTATCVVGAPRAPVGFLPE